MELYSTEGDSESARSIQQTVDLFYWTLFSYLFCKNDLAFCDNGKCTTELHVQTIQPTHNSDYFNLS